MLRNREDSKDCGRLHFFRTEEDAKNYAEFNGLIIDHCGQCFDDSKYNSGSGKKKPRPEDKLSPEHELPEYLLVK